MRCRRLPVCYAGWAAYCCVGRRGVIACTSFCVSIRVESTAVEKSAGEAMYIEGRVASHPWYYPQPRVPAEDVFSLDEACRLLL